MGIQVISFFKPYIPRKGGFVYNVLTLVTGTGLAQVITIGATPILTRLYSPEDFGLLALFLSLNSILLVVASWRYDLAIVLPKEDRAGINVLALACLITLGMSGFCFLVVAFWREDIAHLMNTPRLAPWLWLLPLSLLLAGIFQALTYWNTRKKQFSQQAVAQVGKSMGTVGVQIGAGFWPGAGGGAGLIVGTLAGQLVGAGFLGERVWRQQKQLMAESISPHTIWEQTVRYRKFPFLMNFAGLVNQIAYQIPIWLLAAFYGPHVVGFYLLAQRAAGLPASLVGTSVGQVFFERATQERNQSGSCIRTFKIAFLLLALLAILPFAILMVWGPPIFSLVFGKSWVQAGRFGAILAPFFAVGFITGPLSMVNAVQEKQEIGLAWQLGLVLVSSVSLWGAYKLFHDIITVVLVFSLSMVIWYCIFLVILYQVSKSKLFIKV